MPASHVAQVVLLWMRCQVSQFDMSSGLCDSRQSAAQALLSHV